MSADLFRREIKPLRLKGNILECRISGCGDRSYYIDITGNFDELPAEQLRVISWTDAGWPIDVKIRSTVADLWREYSQHEKFALLRKLILPTK